MTKKPAKGYSLNTLPKSPFNLENISFNLDKQDQFIQSHGVTFIHYKALPSPIGLKDRGEYRRSDAIDTISSNGFIYKKAGCFTAVFHGNGKKNTEIEGGQFNNSTARITLPRYYDKVDENAVDEFIFLSPGDRLYIKDIEVLAVNYQRVQHNPNGIDFLQYPPTCVEHLMDSRGIEFKQGLDYNISKGGIDWLNEGPGFDEDVGTGRVYSIRYRYVAHWYIAQLINEIRVCNVTDDNGDRGPQRMPYHAVIQREYVYHNQTNDGSNENKKQEKDKESRVVQKPTESKNYKIKVNVNDYE